MCRARESLGYSFDQIAQTQVSDFVNFLERGFDFLLSGVLQANGKERGESLLSCSPARRSQMENQNGCGSADYCSVTARSPRSSSSVKTDARLLRLRFASEVGVASQIRMRAD